MNAIVLDFTLNPVENMFVSTHLPLMTLKLIAYWAHLNRNFSVRFPLWNSIFNNVPSSSSNTPSMKRFLNVGIINSVG